MLLAVLEKRGGFLFGMKDVFLNMAGGLKIEDPSIDLAIVAALLSSFEDIPIQHKICFAGEVGLSGEIRPVHRLEQRIAEAEKMGLEKMIVSGYNKKGLSAIRTHLELVAIAKVDELYQQLF
jgi:DNA repair protein RadA/Sms